MTEQERNDFNKKMDNQEDSDIHKRKQIDYNNHANLAAAFRKHFAETYDKSTRDDT